MALKGASTENNPPLAEPLYLLEDGIAVFAL